MKHDYTDEEIKTAWKDSLSLRAFLDALPARLPPLPKTLPPRPPRPEPKASQQEAIDAAFLDSRHISLWAVADSPYWEKEASDRLALAQVYEQVRPQSAEMVELRAELDYARKTIEEKSAEIDSLKADLIHAKSAVEDLMKQRGKAQAELAALRTPIQSDAGISLGQVAFEAFCPGNTWSYLNHLKVPWEAAAQAVAAVVEARMIQRMEAVPDEKLWEAYNGYSGALSSLDGVREVFIAAAKGERQAQAKPSTRIEITEIPDTPTGPVGTLVYAPQAEALPSTQQNKSESSALEKQAVQEAAYILNHYDRKSHADHICLGKKLIREGWKGPNFGKQKSDLKLTLHRSAAEDTPQAEAKAEPAKLLGQHGPKGAPALCGPSAQPVVVNEPPQDEKQPDLSGESEKPAQAEAISTEPEDKRLPPLNEAAPIGHCAVAAAYVHQKLDHLGVPRKRHGKTFTLWGRVEEYAANKAKPEPAQPWTPKPGDVVRLNSGGPVMTVTSDNAGGNHTCTWFNSEDARITGWFPAACLTPARP